MTDDELKPVFIWVSKSNWFCVYYATRQSRSQRPRSFWLADGDRDLWPGPTPEVHDSRTSRYSAHVQSQVWQIWLVLVSIYCVYKAIQNRNVVGRGQRSWFLVLTRRSAASGDENGHAIGLKNSRHFFIQSGVKPKPVVIHSHAFSHTSRQLHVITSCFDWFTWLSVSFVIG